MVVTPLGSGKDTVLTRRLALWRYSLEAMVDSVVERWLGYGYSTGRRMGFYDGTGVVLACGVMDDG